MSVREWMAPEGKVVPDVGLGTRVRFSAVLVKDFEQHWPQAWAGWRRVERSGEGVVVGLRFPYSGAYNHREQWGEEPEPALRKRERTHRAYLVATGLKKKHQLVLAEDFEILADG